VYLGLVLAGATPQVLAQAAMARQFDVKDEIEVKDDLDKKPDDERSPVTASVQIYLEDVEYFLASLGRLKSKGKFDLKKGSFNVAQKTLLPCVDSSIAGRYTPLRFDSSNDSSRRALEFFSRGMVYGYSLGDCIDNNEFNGVTAADSQFDFMLDGNSFAVNVTVKKQSQQSAHDLFESLNSTLKLYSLRENTKLRQRIIENTRFGLRDELVFVRLHLARSDLDSLLATDAK